MIDIDGTASWAVSTENLGSALVAASHSHLTFATTGLLGPIEKDLCVSAVSAAASFGLFSELA